LAHFSHPIQDIIDMDDVCDTDKAEVFKTLEQFASYLMDVWGYEDKSLETMLNEDEYCKNQYNMAKQYFEDGYSVMKKYVDYGDEYCYHKIKQCENCIDDFIILEEEC
jgi:hypothetical protein